MKGPEHVIKTFSLVYPQDISAETSESWNVTLFSLKVTLLLQSKQGTDRLMCVHLYTVPKLIHLILTSFNWSLGSFGEMEKNKKQKQKLFINLKLFAIFSFNICFYILFSTKTNLKTFFIHHVVCFILVTLPNPGIRLLLFVIKTT